MSSAIPTKIRTYRKVDVDYFQAHFGFADRKIEDIDRQNQIKILKALRVRHRQRVDAFYEEPTISILDRAEDLYAPK